MNDSEPNRSGCRIIVDAMGGDFAPRNVVLGTVQALNEIKGIDVYLVGRSDEIKNVLSQENISFDSNKIINAAQVIGMGESPTNALKLKQDSSLVRGAEYVRDSKADAFISAGNTGAMMAASTLIMGRLPGVGRPTIGAEMPSVNGTCFLYDVGAGKDAKPQHLFEYAVMGTIYAREIGRIDNPSVGVLSMGEEEGKGSETSEAALKLLKQSNLNLIGNVEGRDILNGKVDVVVCDGFVGNIILKFGEAVPGLLKHLLSQTAKKSFIDKLKIGLIRGTLRKTLSVMDYQEHGGVPLLGVKGISIIGHGSSTPRAIRNMILKAKTMYDRNLLGKIENLIKQYSVKIISE